MKRKKGFTIIETIISLVILGLISFTITWIDPLKKSYNQKNSHAVDFQLFLNNLESSKKRYVLNGKVVSYLVRMTSKDSGKDYRMFQYNSLIIISGANGGYAPILDEVKFASFKEVKKHLMIKVVFSNNETYEDVSSITYE
ncbi:prepilin-type N-terminal cleavage/methylation domain-containing protein [Lactobacillus kunkeei]|nr:prepilin-type N-terminal cleavage/methylation domain-containing protein [Apilactobacillus kunkeei]